MRNSANVLVPVVMGIADSFVGLFGLMLNPYGLLGIGLSLFFLLGGIWLIQIGFQQSKT